MKKGKKGFTLIELLVAILCASIALTMICGSVIFMSQTSEECISGGEALYAVKNIHAALCAQEISDTGDVAHEGGAIKYRGEALVEDEKIEACSLTSEGGFVYCSLSYDGRDFKFIVGEEEDNG